MSADSKIITTLRERRQIEAHLQEMLATSSEIEYRRLAQQIASLGSAVIPTIVRRLNEADAQMLTAMGTVTTFLNQKEAISALRQAALEGQRSDQGRMGAMIILERFLGEPPDDELLVRLSEPEKVAISSLEAVLEEAERNPAILIEYIQGLDRQEPDVVLAVARALRGLDDRRAVEPLRMMALDVRGEIGAESLQALGAMRLPEAAQALQMLVPCVASDLRALAARALRKLRFAGVEIADLPSADPIWRALLSPVDGLGQQRVWFLLEDSETGHARLLHVLLNDRAGAVEAVGHAQVLSRMLVPRRPVGTQHDIEVPDGSGALLMLETTFDIGRKRVQDALALNRKTQIPIAAVLRFLSQWLWGYDQAAEQPEHVIDRLYGPAQDHPVDWGRLLAHPAFAKWKTHNAATLQTAAESLRHPAWEIDIWVERLAGELFSEPVVAQVFRQRLLNTSDWLQLAGEAELAGLALAAAESVSSAQQESSFVRAFVRRELELAQTSLKTGAEPSFGVKDKL